MSCCCTRIIWGWSTGSTVDIQVFLNQCWEFWRDVSIMLTREAGDHPVADKLIPVLHHRALSSQLVKIVIFCWRVRACVGENNSHSGGVLGLRLKLWVLQMHWGENSIQSWLTAAFRVEGGKASPPVKQPLIQCTAEQSSSKKRFPAKNTALKTIA